MFFWFEISKTVPVIGWIHSYVHIVLNVVLVNTLNSHTFEDESLEETIKLLLQEYELSKKRKKWIYI